MLAVCEAIGEGGKGGSSRLGPVVCGVRAQQKGAALLHMPCMKWCEERGCVVWRWTRTAVNMWAGFTGPVLPAPVTALNAERMCRVLRAQQQLVVVVAAVVVAMLLTAPIAIAQACDLYLEVEPAKGP